MPADSASSIRAVTRDGGLDTDGAQALYAALLAGDMPSSDVETVTAAWRARRATLAETTGFVRALDARTARLERPADAPRPVLLPAYHGTRRGANLTALIALLLRRYELPVVVHGLGAAECLPPGDDTDATPDPAPGQPVSTFDVFREFAVLPASSPADAQTALRRNKLALVPLAVLAPGLARLVAGKQRLRPAALASTLAKLVDPFGGDGFRVVGTAPGDDCAGLRAFLLASRAEALLFEGTEGEPFADPAREPGIESFSAGARTLCAEPGGGCNEPPLPAAADARATAAWIADVLAGRQPLPSSIVTQLGCCLAGARGVGGAT